MSNVKEDIFVDQSFLSNDHMQTKYSAPKMAFDTSNNVGQYTLA